MKTNVLIVDGGGRGHALADMIAVSPEVNKVYCAPGNGGTANEWKTENVNIQPTEIEKLLSFAKEKNIVLTVVGSEEPLAAGIVDHFWAKGLTVFGPSQEASKLESSKGLAHHIMDQAGVPSAQYIAFTNYDDAVAYVKGEKRGFVVKADGLAEGKGVKVCDSVADTIEAITGLMVRGENKEAGKKRVILESKITGHEFSHMTICSEHSSFPLPVIMDHKRRMAGERGPMTGGMGAVGPIRFLEDFFPNSKEFLEEQITQKILNIMRARKTPFFGCLYAGMMATRQGPRVLEFNVRFGDPETQVLAMLLKNQKDFFPILYAAARGESLHWYALDWRMGSAITVALVSEGYPGPFSSGKPIIMDPSVRRMEGVRIFHGGTSRKGKALFTNGGRVLYVSAYAHSLIAAREKAYEAIDRINFDGCRFRGDIGEKALELSQKSKIG